MHWITGIAEVSIEELKLDPNHQERAGILLRCARRSSSATSSNE
jgi:hypothetical protein